MTTRNQTATLVYIDRMARQLQETFPEIGVVARDLTYDNIIDEYALISSLNLSQTPKGRKMAKSIIGAALNGTQRGLEGLADDELHTILENRSRTELKRYRERCGSKIGTALLNDDKRREISQAGVMARGRTPIKTEEINYVIERAQGQLSNGRRSISWKKISMEINAKYHSGEKVRTNRSVKAIYAKYKL